MKKILTIVLLIICNYLKAQDYGNWYIADSLKEARQYPASIVLSDSNIFVTGGGGGETGDDLKSSEIFDVKSEKWKPAAPMINGRSYHELILLDNKKVLAIGGYKNKSCEIYDPLAYTWTLTDSLLFEVLFGSRIIKMDNGNVLKTGGIANDPNKPGSIYLNKTEIYDVSNGKWFETDSLNFERSDHTITLLSNGKVLVAGGIQKDKSTQERRTIILKSCEIYDPVLKKWEVVDSLEIKRYSHSSYLMDNGNIFISGGRNDGTSWLSSCEVYDSQLNQWSYVGEMSVSRMKHSIMPYSKDHVIMFGGVHGTETWEIFNLNTFKPVYVDNYPVNQAASTSELLPNNKIINIGGFSWFQNNLFPTDLTLIFDPDYTVGIEKDSKTLPQSIKLYQNYPNPFNPTTVITYYLPIGSFIELKVYDVLGHEVTILEAAYKSPGYHKVQFNASGFSSGVYIYQLTDGTRSISKKMVLTK